MSEEPEDPETDDEAGEGEDEDVPPGVVLSTVAEIANWMPAGIAKRFGDRPVWFILADDAELVGIFERIPEDPMGKGHVDAILGGLRAFAADRSEALQAVLGPTDGIGVGFHVDAKPAQVRESFEDDGFDVVATVKAGDLEEEAPPSA